MLNKIQLGTAILFAIVLAITVNPERTFLVAAAILYVFKSIQVYRYQSKEEQDD